MRRALLRFGQPGDLILDPFGAAPRLAIEAAQAGRAVLVAANNPVVRYVLHHTARPFSLDELQAALSYLANSTKDDQRLEPFLLDLYRTQCSRCGEWVSAEYFVWDKEAGQPVLRFYSCPHCNHTIEEPVTAFDRARAAEYSSSGLHHAMALEQLAPSSEGGRPWSRGDADRQHAEDALEVYPERAIYAVVTLLNKIEQLEGGQQAATALMLSALDQANALWGHPEGRSRPLQLVASARYLESNVWRALERAIGHWALEDPGVELRDWDGELELRPGSITLFAGPVRSLAEQLPERSIDRVLTVIPRPNQAFWTLSALWAAWLWGRAAADPIRPVLRRRRYDWAWHAEALKATLNSVSDRLSDSVELLGFVLDAEPGFLAAALAGFDGSGFELTGRALRVAEQQALLSWKAGGGGMGPRHAGWLESPMREAAQEALRRRGQPARYPLPHAAAWSALAADRWLANVEATEKRSAISVVGEQLDRTLSDSQVFQHLGRGQEPESGRYWLVEAAAAEPPLADRVEGLVLEALRSSDSLRLDELDAQLCLELPGLLTPDRRYLEACLRSYALRSAEDGRWRLRPEDRREARAADREQIAELLIGLGERLGYQVERQPIVGWMDGERGNALTFEIRETARLGQPAAQPSPGHLSAQPSLGLRPAQPARSEAASAGDRIGEADHTHQLLQAIVIPGGRGALIAEKANQNPLLQAWLDSSPPILKFRHVRRLAEDPTLDRHNLFQRLTLDPPGPEDPQLPLL